MGFHSVGAAEASLGEGTEMAALGNLRRLRYRGSRLFTRSNWSLLVELVRASYKVSEYNSFLGMAWSLVAPVGTLLVLYFVFSSRFGSEVKAYPLYLMVGVVLVNFFGTVTGSMISVFLNNVDLLLNSSVPRETLILSRLAIQVFRLLAQLLLCAGLSVYYGLFSWISLLLVIPLLLSYLALVLSVGMVLALAYCFARDVDYIWGLAAPLWFFATPVFYGLDSLSPSVRALLYWLNPLTPFLLSFREAFATGSGVSGAFWHSLGLGAAALAISYSLFLVLESTALERA